MISQIIDLVIIYDNLFSPFLSSGGGYIEEYIAKKVKSKNLRSYLKKR